MAVEPGGVGVFDETGGGAEAAGDAGSDAAGLGGFGFELVDERGHGGDGGVVVALGGVDAMAGEFVAGFVEGEGFDLGAAEVDAYAHGWAPGQES